MRVLMYGIGQGLEWVEKQLGREHEIVGYTDSNSSIPYFNGKSFYPVGKIKELSFDYVVITVLNRKVSWEIYNLLKSAYGIEKEKIIPFYIYARSELYYRRYCRYEGKKIEGLIFGNSHAHFGFLTDYMSRNFLNLSCESQDIYCNYKILLQCKKKMDKLENLKYVIIDLYDYYYFNCDMSMGKFLLDYIAWGGVIEEHHFKNNKNYKGNFKEELFKEKYILVDKSFCENAMQKLFHENGMWEDDKPENDRWGHIDRNAALPANVVSGGNVMHRHDTVIKENFMLLEEMIKEIRGISEDIKIIFTLIPRFESMERVMEVMLLKWKEEFVSIVQDFQHRWNGILFWNFKEYEEISKNNNFFADVGHLNTIGGKCLTAILEKKLEKLEA